MVFAEFCPDYGLVSEQTFSTTTCISFQFKRILQLHQPPISKDSHHPIRSLPGGHVVQPKLDGPCHARRADNGALVAAVIALGQEVDEEEVEREVRNTPSSPGRRRRTSRPCSSWKCGQRVRVLARSFPIRNNSSLFLLRVKVFNVCKHLSKDLPRFWKVCKTRGFNLGRIGESLLTDVPCGGNFPGRMLSPKSSGSNRQTTCGELHF